MIGKFIIIIFFVTCAFSELNAQSPHAKSDYAIAGLKGKVKKLVTSSYKYLDDGRKSVMLWEYTDTSYYNKSGNLILEIRYASDSSQNSKTICTYDKRGKNVYRKTTYDVGDTVKEESITSYDARGNLTEDRKTDRATKTTDIERYFYDEKHRCILIKHSHSGISFTSGDSVTITEEVRNTLNEKGLVVKQEHVDERGNVKNTLINEYDARGNITLITIYGDKAVIRKKFAEGKWVETKVTTSDNKPLGVSSYSYDAFGRQTRSKGYDARGFVVDDLEHDYEQNDKQGNWLVVHICYMNKPARYEERKITYYR